MGTVQPATVGFHGPERETAEGTKFIRQSRRNEQAIHTEFDDIIFHFLLAMGSVAINSIV
jgi:hypothetical protein